MSPSIYCLNFTCGVALNHISFPFFLKFVNLHILEIKEFCRLRLILIFKETSWNCLRKDILILKRCIASCMGIFHSTIVCHFVINAWVTHFIFVIRVKSRYPAIFVTKHFIISRFETLWKFVNSDLEKEIIREKIISVHFKVEGIQEWFALIPLPLLD